MHDMANAMFPPSEIRRQIRDGLTARLEASETRRASLPVTPVEDLSDFRKALRAYDFDGPVDLSQLLDWTVGAMDTGIVQMSHPAYFGLFNPAPTLPSECADRIAASFNPQLAVWSHAPVCVEIERHVLQAVARRAGLAGDVGGHFTSGGAEANYTALICALTRANGMYGAKGVFAFAGRPVFYASAESHLAWLKIAHQAGIGRDSVRLVSTDGSGRMSIEALMKAIETDLASGCVPVMIVATAGTTNAGMIDPLEGCACVAEKHGLWLHVDAAWAGAMIASKSLSPMLEGIGKATSITIDAHKWFATTMGAGMFLTARPDVLSQAFQVAASYMPSNLQTVDPYVTSAQWSRRFLGLQLFLSLANAGWQGYAEHVERAVDLLRRVGAAMSAEGWQVANDCRAGVLCLKPPAGAHPPVEIVQRIVASGCAWISVAKLEGDDVIRVCITNGTTRESDVDALATLLARTATGWK